MTGQLWSRPHLPNQGAALSGMVGIGAPLVAGAQLTTIGVILTQPSTPQLMPEAGPALAVMCLSLVLMVGSIQYGFWAVSFWNSPDKALAWNPAAATDLTALQSERRTLAHHARHFQRLKQWAEVLFRGGLVLFLLALALLLHPPRVLPSSPASTGPSLLNDVGLARWRLVGQYIMFAALAVELYWLVPDTLRKMLRVVSKVLSGVEEFIGRLRRRWPVVPRWKKAPNGGTKNRYRDWILRAVFRLLVTANRLVNGISESMWTATKPVLPSRWRPPYLPVDRPDQHAVQAVFGDTTQLRDCIAKAIREMPREWGKESISWQTGDKVAIAGTLLQGRVWTDTPWGIFADEKTMTVVHPLGAIQGAPKQVSDRLVAMKGLFFNSGRRRAQTGFEDTRHRLARLHTEDAAAPIIRLRCLAATVVHDLDRAGKLIGGFDRKSSRDLIRRSGLAGILGNTHDFFSVRALFLADDLAVDRVHHEALELVVSLGLTRDLARALEEAPDLDHVLAFGLALNDSRDRADAFADLLQRFRVDASEADLSDLDLSDVRVLDGVVWNGQTDWPSGWITKIQKRSWKIADGVWRVAADGEGEAELPTA